MIIFRYDRTLFQYFCLRFVLVIVTPLFCGSLFFKETKKESIVPDQDGESLARKIDDGTARRSQGKSPKRLIEFASPMGRRETHSS
jgi:hypothetical protein